MHPGAMAGDEPSGPPACECDDNHAKATKRVLKRQSEQVRAINFASAVPSKIRGRAEFGLYLRLSVAWNPYSVVAEADRYC